MREERERERERERDRERERERERERQRERVCVIDKLKRPELIRISLASSNITFAFHKLGTTIQSN